MILPKFENYSEWAQKMQDLAQETQVSSSLIYVGFETVEAYLNSNEKDKDFFRDKMAENYFAEIMNIFLKGPSLLAASDSAELYTADLKPVDIDPIKESLKEALSEFPNGNEWEARRYAFRKAREEVMRFTEKKAKHPFDYVLEDLKDDIEIFYKIELFFKITEGSN
ncbi:MAG: hypothetical protein ACTHMD_14925 [Flavisolibacter sp.]